jgi:hypothetical protein
MPMLSSNPLPLYRRFCCLALLVLMTAGPVGCGSGGGGGSSETISTGGGAVIPKQELENLGATEKSLAPPPKVKKAK